MAVIRSASMLPAKREALTLQTADGLDLVGELALPADREPEATVICVHPLPTHGGMMDSHVFRKAAWRLPALADMAVLRFNTRGTESQQGKSQGAFDNGVGERFDVAAAVEYAEFAELPRVWLVGWSFGTDLTLKYGLEPGVEGAVLLSPPLRYTKEDELQRWAEDGRPLLALIPEQDDYLQYPEAQQRFAAVPQAELVEIENGGHLWVGKAEEALDRIVGRILPDRAPLPRTWDGPMERGDTSAYADKTVAAFGGFLPKAGEEQGLPKAGEEQGAPKTGQEQGAPKAGEEQDLPKTGEEQGLPKAGEEQGPPKTGDGRDPKSGEA